MSANPQIVSLIVHGSQAFPLFQSSLCPTLKGCIAGIKYSPYITFQIKSTLDIIKEFHDENLTLRYIFVFKKSFHTIMMMVSVALSSRSMASVCLISAPFSIALDMIKVVHSFIQQIAETCNVDVYEILGTCFCIVPFDSLDII